MPVVRAAAAHAECLIKSLRLIFFMVTPFI